MDGPNALGVDYARNSISLRQQEWKAEPIHTDETSQTHVWFVVKNVRTSSNDKLAFFDFIHSLIIK